MADCLDDEQVLVDAERGDTIVSGTPGNRPSNATRACGIAWLARPHDGDGSGHVHDGLLIVRNTLSSTGFGSAVQDVATPGTQRAVMGAYLPTGSYTMKKAFEALRCR